MESQVKVKLWRENERALGLLSQEKVIIKKDLRREEKLRW